MLVGDFYYVVENIFFIALGTFLVLFGFDDFIGLYKKIYSTQPQDILVIFQLNYYFDIIFATYSDMIMDNYSFGCICF